MQLMLKVLLVVLIAIILGCGGGGGSGDGSPPVSGLDTDRDGVPDDLDAFPTDPNETADFDGDGIGDNADTDDDADGIADSDDPRPHTKLKKAAVTGTFLVEPPVLEMAPMKVLFAIDCSMTMLASDPGTIDSPFGQRIEAVRRFINRYNTTEHTNISFSIMLWSGDVIDQTLNANGDPGFTRSADELSRVLDNVTLTPYTDYMATLHAIRDVIHNDINTTLLDASGETSVARTRYSVCFLSDGVPSTDTGEQPQGDIWNLVEELDTRTAEWGAGEFNLHAFFLSALFRDASGVYLTDPATVTAREYAENTLFGMVQRGNGSFRDFASADDIDFINFADLRLTVDYRLQGLIAYNLNVLPHADGLQEDSDADGLTDAEEYRPTGAGAVATDPTIADTDADGLSDHCELSLSESGQFQDPTVPDSGPCPSLPDGSYEDSDGDGLNDCEENAMGMDPHMADMDGDTVPDHVEHLYGSDPLLDDVLADSDLDGEIDLFEIRKHTNIRVDDPILRMRHPYFYEIIDAGRDPVSLLRRYDFRVSNIGILDTGGRKVGGIVELLPGENRIRLLISQVPEDMPDAPPIFRAADVILDYGSETHEEMLLNSDFHIVE